MLREVLRTLALNETRVILLVETGDSTPERQAVEELHTQLSHALNGLPAPVLLLPESDEDRRCLVILETLRTVPVFIGLWPARPGYRSSERAANRQSPHRV